MLIEKHLLSLRTIIYSGQCVYDQVLQVTYAPLRHFLRDFVVQKVLRFRAFSNADAQEATYLYMILVFKLDNARLG